MPSLPLIIVVIWIFLNGHGIHVAISIVKPEIPHNHPSSFQWLEQACAQVKAMIGRQADIVAFRIIPYAGELVIATHVVPDINTRRIGEKVL